MPRIRKKTSNRQNTRDRAKITKKVAEHKKKSKRDTKRQTTWKSKKKPDLGVPSSFHLKDQVLAEIAEEKRRAIEAKTGRKNKVEVEEEEDAPGISSVGGSSVLAREAISGVSSLPVEEESDDDVPELFDSDLPTLQAALDAAHVLLEVVDARDIAGGRSASVEELVSESGAKVLLIVNKVDLVPREALEGWLAHLDLPTFLFSSTGSLGRDELLSALATLAKGKKDEPLKAALVGLPSVGKTSVLNTLLGKAQFKTAPAVPLVAAAKSPAPTTSAPVEIEVPLPTGGSVHIIDTPGWEYVGEDVDEDEDEDEERDEDEQDEKWDQLETLVAGDLLRRNLGRVDRVKDVFPLVNYIVQRSNAQDLMLRYNVPYFESGDIEAFLTGLARVNQRVKKHGEPNHDAAARIVLADWAHNRFPYYTPAPPAGSGMDVEVDFERPDMSAVLAQCRSRKELKADKGIVRFRTSEVDSREVFLDDDYTAVERDDEDDFGMDEDEDEEDEDEDEEDDDEDEDEEGYVIGSSEGEELELEDGPEPSSGSDVEDDEDEDEESEPEPEPQPVSRKRKAPAPEPEVRKKPKTVSFGRKLEAPRSKPSPVPREVKPILKPTPAPAPVPVVEPKKSALKKAKKETAAKPAKAPKVPKAAAEPKPKTKATKAKAQTNGSAAGGSEAYDFSKYF